MKKYILRDHQMEDDPFPQLFPIIPIGGTIIFQNCRWCWFFRDLLSFLTEESFTSNGRVFQIQIQLLKIG